MKNPAPYIRTALVTLLNGTITYDGGTVPCYSGEGEIDEPYQIFLSNQTWSKRNDKASFTKYFTQTIEVVSRQETDIVSHVDAIGGEIMELMTPTPTSHAIPNSADFQVLNVEADTPNYLKEVDADGNYINRLLIEYKFFINQF